VPHKGTFACFDLSIAKLKAQVSRMDNEIMIDRETSERSLKRH
jgi:hypothetical protein